MQQKDLCPDCILAKIHYTNDKGELLDMRQDRECKNGNCDRCSWNPVNAKAIQEGIGSGVIKLVKNSKGLYQYRYSSDKKQLTVLDEPEDYSIGDD